MKKIFCALPVLLMSVVLSVEAAPLRIMPVGDSITRGSHLVVGNMTANPQAGGYRKPLQDKLRAAGFDYEFVGETGRGDETTIYKYKCRKCGKRVSSWKILDHPTEKGGEEE